VQPLDEYARRDPNAHPDGFYRGLIADGKVGGTLYQLPFARSAPLLYLNLDLLRAAGVPETPPATWDDLLAAARQVVRARSTQAASEELSEASAAAAALGVTTSYWEFQPLLWAFGGAYSDARLNVQIDSPASTAAGQYLADLAHRYQVAVPTKAAMTEFLQGQRAFFHGSTSSLTQIEGNPLFRASAAPLPSPAPGMGGTRGIPGSGAGLSILAPVPRPRQDAAWQFLAFMTRATSTAYFAQATGYTPVRPEALALPEMRRFLEQFPDARVAQAQFDELRPVDAILGTPFAGLRIEEALQRILFDRADVRQTFASLAGELRQAP
jgi:sn-glycerol 3-phosphate transport system substrate-binding protein